MGFRFNGRTSQSFGLATRQTKENRMPDFTNNTVTVPGREGVFDFGETIGERKIEISCFIPPGKTDEEFLARKDEIIAWLNPDNGLKDLILDKEPGRVYRARLEGGFSFDKAVRNSCTFDLTFLCPDPYAYAEADETYEFTEPGTFTVSRSLGNADSLPVYSLTAELTKETKAVITTNGNALEISGRLAKDEILVIDSSLMTAMVTDQDGNTLRNGLPLVNSLDFPELKAGENTLVIDADISTTKAVKKLSTQDAFTGQVPSSWGADGLWRFNESEPDSSTSLTDSSGKGRSAVISGWSGTTASLPTGRLGRSFRMNINDPPTEKTYLKVTNDGTIFQTFGETIAVGGWFMPTTYSVGNTFCPLFNTRYGPGQPILYLSLLSGKPRIMLYDSTGTLILDKSVTPSFTLENAAWYFIACLIKPVAKTAQYILGSRSTGAVWESDVLGFTGTLNASCTADLVWGMHADSYWYAGNFDDWFLDCDSDLTVDDISLWFRESLSANAADSDAIVDGLTTEDAVTLKATSGAYPSSGTLTTAAVTYGIEGTCLVSVDADLPDGTGIGVETSTSDDLMAWSDWAATGDDGSVKSAAGQYIRFRLTLATTDTSTTPTLRSISLSVPGESAFRKLVINAHSRWR
ncbi:distal tail protein Dit [Bifidobacterium animalis]|jgi:predicted phage tail component-like protein|uniref:distal tail protein Dit n=1 Tax=Bifidobacterium animalis TaxID=28025 RepID=UPI0026B6E863